MRKRPRPSCSFQPKLDELEKLTGVSSLAIGGLLAASLDVVGQSATQSPIPRPVAPGHDSGPTAPRQSATSTPNVVSPKIHLSSAPAPRVFLTAQTDQASNNRDALS